MHKSSYGIVPLQRLFALFSFQFCAATIVTLLFPADPKNAILLGFSFIRLILAGGLLALSLIFLFSIFYIRRNPKIAGRIFSILLAPQFPVVLSVAFFIICYSCYLFNKSQDFLFRFSPVLISSWLSILESIFVNHHYTCKIQADPVKVQKTYKPLLALLCGILLYTTAIIPGSSPSLIDSSPWNTPAKFIWAGLLTPLAFLFNGRFFTKRSIIVLSSVLLAIKLICFFAFPMAGLMVRIYPFAEDQVRSTWVKSYSTLLIPGMTDRLSEGYNGFFEFPIEWINENTDPQSIKFLLTLDGYALVRKGESLAFLVQGTRDGTVQLKDLSDGEISSANLIDDSQPFDYSSLTPVSETKIYQVNGKFLFQGNIQYHLLPVVIDAKGDAQSAFSAGSLWIDSQGASQSFLSIRFFSFLSVFLSLLLLGISSFAILQGLVSLIRTKKITSVDLFLCTSGICLFLVYQLLSPSQIENIAPWVIIVFGALKILSVVISQPVKSRNLWLQWFMAIGVPVLIIFLSLDISHLKDVFIFPVGQDNLEYQILARKIFPEGDFFLRYTSPRAYKILFPYLAGLFHLFFGQSPASLFFFNAWCAIITASLLISLSEDSIPDWAKLLPAWFFLIIIAFPSLFIFYFRFGLIEPVAVLCLVAGLTAAKHQKAAQFIFFGILCTLFRADYIGAVAASVLFFYPSINGNFIDAWRKLLSYGRNYWKKWLLYFSLIFLPLVFVILFHFFTHPNYMLNAGDTRQSSLLTILGGLFRLSVGGNLQELVERFQHNPLDAGLVSIPLAVGTLFSIADLFFRRHRFSKVDLRWGIVILGLFSAYIIVHPTGYAPRFSTPLLPFALLMIQNGLFSLITGTPNSSKTITNPGFCKKTFSAYSAAPSESSSPPSKKSAGKGFVSIRNIFFKHGCGRDKNPIL